MEYIVEMLNITKEFTGVIANDNVTLEIKPQEIHALLGENGAGKSTLMNVLFGILQPEKGIIKIRGEEVKMVDPNAANDLKIGMVHQHFKLVHNFTVTENIILGKEPKKSLFEVDIKKAREKVKEISEKYKLAVDVDAKIEDITVGMQQRVEILKMLYRDAEILIFDEPTAVLTPQEIEELMSIMRDLVKQGKTILLITHKLKEIKEVADRCTILRRGKYIGTYDVKNLTEHEMAENMVGRPINFTVEKKDHVAGKSILKIENVSVKNSRGLKAVDGVSFDVKEGEIMCIAGIDGNGQTHLIEAIYGLRKLEQGKVIFKDEDITNFKIRKRVEEGIGMIPSDRQKHGLVLDFSLENNLILLNYYQKPFSNKGLFNFNEINKNAETLIKEFDVRSGEGAKNRAGGLSGGNQQKSILAREVNRSPKLLIAAQPTRGLDVGAIEYIHERLIAERNKGKAILLMSLELDEVLAISDRIAVMYEGKIVGIVDADKTSKKELGLMMSGGDVK